MKKIMSIAISIVVLITSVLFLLYIHHENSREFLTVAFLDVGQGDAIFIESPNGKQILIDGGEGSVVVRKLSKLIPFYDRTIDMILATHHDSDHAGGFPEIFKRFHVQMYGVPPKEDSDGLFFELERLSERERSNNIILTAGDKIVLDTDKEIFIKIIWPPRDIVIDENNESSIVAYLSYGDTSFLLTGDASREIERKIISTDIDVESDVLKLGHHGSKTATSEEFIQTVKPKYSIISAGEGNKFGQPHEEVLEILSKTKTEVLRTSELGNIIFQSNGEELWLVN